MTTARITHATPAGERPGSTHPERASADAILSWFQTKVEWNVGTEQSLYAKFEPKHHTVNTLHRAVIIGKLGSRIGAILRDWASEKWGAVTGRMLYFPRSWPRNAKQRAEDTRNWARCVVSEAEEGRVRLPERALAALRQHTIEPTQVQQPTPTQQGPPANPRDLMLARDWYLEANRGLQFSGAAGHSQVSFSTNPSDLLRLVGQAGTAGRARTEDVMAIVRARMVLMNESNMEHNFRADQHGAVILYYADCLRELYTKVTKLQRTKSARTPGSTPELRTVLGFPEKNTPESERAEIRAWCRQQLSKAQSGDDSEMTRSMRTYLLQHLADPNSTTSPEADPGPSPVPRRRHVHVGKVPSQGTGTFPWSDLPPSKGLYYGTRT